MESYDLHRLGYNDDHVYARKKDAGVFRILSFGGSFTFGITRPQYTFNAFLRKDLGELVKNRRFEILNLGRPGAGFHDIASEYAFWARNIEYDAVVFTLYPGANFETKKDAVPKPLRYGPGLFVPHHNMIRMFDYVSTIVTAASALKEEKDTPYFSAYPFPYDVYVQKMAHASRPYQEDDYETFEAGLSNLFALMRMARDEAREGKRILFVVAGPHFLYAPKLRDAVLRERNISAGAIEPLLPGAVIAAMARAAGVGGATFDLTACLAVAPDAGERIYYKTDTHWSLDGNLLVGELLSDRIAADWFGVGKAPECGVRTVPSGSPLWEFAQREAGRIADKAGGE